MLANTNTTCVVGCSDGHVGSLVPVAILAATAPPAVANRSRTLPAIVAAATQGGWIGGAGSVAIGGPLIAGGATGGAGGGGMAGGGDPADRAQASVKEQHVRGHLCPASVQTRSCTRRTHDCSGSPMPTVGYAACTEKPSIRMMATTLTMGLVSPKMPSGNGSTFRLPHASCCFTTSQTANRPISS